MPFLANNNLIQVDNGSTTIFNTNLRMPHIVSSVSGIFTTQDAPLTISGYSYTVNSSINIYVSSSASYKFANSFCYAYIKPIHNAERTEIDTGNPIFVAGTLCTRIYIENNGYRGSLLITPRAWDGQLGFVQEHTYRFDRSTEPKYLYIGPTNDYINPGIAFAYTLYYGRFS